MYCLPFLLPQTELAMEEFLNAINRFMRFFSRLFGGKKKKEPAAPELSDEQFEKDYEEKKKGLENVLGEMYGQVGHAIIPFSYIYFSTSFRNTFQPGYCSNKPVSIRLTITFPPFSFRTCLSFSPNSLA